MPLLIRQDDLLLRIVKDLNDIRASLRRVVGNIPLFDISNENTPDEIQVDQDNYVPGNFDILRLSANAPHIITGFRGGTKGRFLRIFNVGIYELTLAHQSLTSDFGNRINSPTGFDIVINPGGEQVLYYDFTNSQWICSYSSNADRISCQLQLSVPFSVPDVSGTVDFIPWDVVMKDTGAFFDPANPTYVTIPATGWYHFSTQVEWDIAVGYAASHYMKTEIRDTLDYTLASDMRGEINFGGADVSLNRTVYCLKGRRIGVHVAQFSGAAKDILVALGVGGALDEVRTEFNVVQM